METVMGLKDGVKGRPKPSLGLHGAEPSPPIAPCGFCERPLSVAFVQKRQEPGADGFERVTHLMLDRLRAYIHHLGGLPVRQAVDKAERERLASALGERGDGVRQRGAEVGEGGGVARLVADAVEVGERVQAGGVADVVERPRDDDAKQEPAERPLRVDAVAVLPDPDVGLLGEVVGDGRVGDAAAERGEQVRVRGVEKAPERGPVAEADAGGVGRIVPSRPAGGGRQRDEPGGENGRGGSDHDAKLRAGRFASPSGDAADVRNSPAVAERRTYDATASSDGHCFAFVLRPRPLPDRQTRSLSESLKNYGRGLVGGLLFAFAPLYTMEIWYQGFIVKPSVLLVAIAGTYVVLVAYAFYAGLHSDRSILYNMAEALETIAIGFVVAFIVLKLIGQLSSDLSTSVYLARLTLEGMTCSIGVAIGSDQLGEDPDDVDDSQPGSQGGLKGLIHQIAYSVLGATIIIAGVAPTEEVVVTAIEAPIPSVLITSMLSFLLALGIVHSLDFRGSGKAGKVYAGGALGDALVTYSIALVLSAIFLWSVGRFQDIGLGAGLGMTVYLAWPATLGAAVGRLLL